ncbi:DUF302 domain-containing protein [Cupriavidus necator]|uniref:DUF302 domain-containing protein n=1 Tax=Cupriavidus necator TaxID=106590 RepID=UPI001E5CD94B|nr:DUF302 domain-containing protein [Cupriavidus necator]WKA44375.1 DUF302 domain-containing protein [Cupriavidus necator]
MLIYDNARRGTPLMLAAPSVALDLPLRVLVRDDCQGSTWMSCHTAAELESALPLPAGSAAPPAVAQRLILDTGGRARRPTVIYPARPLFGLIRYFSPVARLL